MNLPQAAFTHDPSTVWLSFGILAVALLAFAAGFGLSMSRFGAVRLLGWFIGSLGALLLIFSSVSALKYGVTWDDPTVGASPTLTIFFASAPFVFLCAVAGKIWKSHRRTAA